MEDYRVTQTGDEIQEILNQSPIDTADIAELKEAATSLDGRLESVEVKIPAGASEDNPLTDKQYVDDSIASASATFRGTYNEVTDLELTTEATHAEIGEALASVIDTADSNDYCFVQIPTADATPTEIESIERYKFVTGTGWQYEYTLNNSGFTADQWAAINSGITSGLVAKLTDLPTNAELNTLLNGKANAADVYTKSETYTKTEIDTQLGAKANSADVYPKTDTYTKQEVDALITTPEVQYVTVTATSGTTSVTDVLPATGAANTIYRVGSWDGTQYATGVYSEYAWNGTTYILLDVKNYGFATGSDFDNPTTAQRELVTTVGSVLDGISEGVFDLTAKTGDSYATLADALTAANTSIPTNKKKGGMSIKFVQSSDNKYVEYFLTKNTWSASEDDWKKMIIIDEVSQLDRKVNDKYERASFEIARTEAKIDGESIINKEFSWSNGYVQTTGKIASSNLSLFCQPILFFKGETLKYKTAGTYGAAVVSVNNPRQIAVGDTIQIAAILVNAAAQNVEYTYEFEEDTYVVINVAAADYTIYSEVTSTNTVNDAIADVNGVADDAYSFIIGEELTKSLVWSNGYINTSGLIASSTLSKYTQPFMLRKGQKLSARTNSTNITIIGTTNAKTISVGDTITPIKTTGSSGGFKTFEYTATDDIMIVVCVTWEGHTLSFSYSNGSLSEQIEDKVNESIGEIRPWILNNYFTGNDNTWIYQSIYGLKPGFKYRFIIRNPDYDKTGITQTGVYLFAIYNRKTDESTTLLVGESISSSGILPTIQDYYDLVIPDDSKEIIVGGRAALDEKVEFAIMCIQSDEPEDTPFSIPQKIIDYSLLFKGTTGAVESFLFFTDPHWYNRYEDSGLNPIYKNRFDTLVQMWEKSPTDFVLCCGDWLTAHKQSIAIEDLANIDALMNKMIGAYYPVFGNHDDNYQGELDETEDTSANDGAIAKETIVNLWFRKWGKAYYSFKGSSSKFFIFDSGIDWNSTMDAYKWGQIAWFAQGLIDNQDEHIVLGMHIVCNSGDVFTQNTAPLANNILLMAQAFNAKNTIMLNGITYDFTNAHGTVHCALCGHTHYDASAVINGIPVFCTAAARDGVFDLILIDYGSEKLKSIRVGTGSDRELTLA